MIDLRNRQLPAVADVVEGMESTDDLEWFGFDPQHLALVTMGSQR